MAACNGSKRSTILVGMPTTYQKLKIFTNHWVDLLYVSENNDIVIVTPDHDANHNSSCSINENENYGKYLNELSIQTFVVNVVLFLLKFDLGLPLEIYNVINNHSSNIINGFAFDYILLQMFRICDKKQLFQ